jgi:hypothetical protein
MVADVTINFITTKYKKEEENDEHEEHEENGGKREGELR